MNLALVEQKESGTLVEESAVGKEDRCPDGWGKAGIGLGKHEYWRPKFLHFPCEAGGVASCWD